MCLIVFDLTSDYLVSIGSLSQLCETHAKQSRPVLFIVSLLQVAWLLPVLDSDGSLHLLDYARDLKLGLSHWAVESMGAA